MPTTLPTSVCAALLALIRAPENCTDDEINKLTLWLERALIRAPENCTDDAINKLTLWLEWADRRLVGEVKRRAELSKPAELLK